jgi:hypothetical protein
MAKNGFEGLTVETILGNMPAEEFFRSPPEQRLLLRRPGWFVVSFALAMAVVAGIVFLGVRCADLIVKLLG